MATGEHSIASGSQPVQVGRRGGRTSRLQRNFLCGLAIIFFFFCIFAALLIYNHEKHMLEQEARAKAEMVLAAVEASRSYVREVVRPKMYEILGDDAFVLEAMSTSFVGRAVMDRFRHTLPEYRYRRVAFHARNPAFAPNRLEAELIRYFAAHPEVRRRQGIVEIAGRAHFIQAQPVYFSASCMHCHGDPVDAPADLVELYGAERGFGHRPGEIAGLTAVTIPVDVALAEIKGRAYSVFLTSLFCLSILYLMVSFLFNRLVVHNLQDVLEVFQENLRDEEERSMFREMGARDEIGALTTAAQLMAEHLRDSRQQLEHYAQNLEGMVAERTRALQDSEQRLRDQVAARNRELHCLNNIAELITRFVSLDDILPRVLRRILAIIPARGAALYLLQEDPSRLEIACAENAADLQETLPFDAAACDLDPDRDPVDLNAALCEAACGIPSFFAAAEKKNLLTVPLCCRGRVLGVMAMVDVDFQEITPELHELLFSIGQQVGITIESLQNTQKLVESKELLQSVIDGITDFLILLDRDLRIKMVNKAYLERFGVALEEVRGKKCRETNSCETCPFTTCNIEAVIESGRPQSEEILGSNGEIYLVHYYPLVDEAGKVQSLIRYAKDITAQKKMEQRIQQAEKLVAVGQLASGIAHEINNPLGVILCHTDLLKRQLADFPEGYKDVATIERHARVCQQIVSDLLKFARGQNTERQLLPPNRLIKEVISMLIPQFRKQKAELEVDLQRELPLANLDGDKIKQVLLNLLMNSLQAIGPKGKIRIKSRLPADAAAISISIWDNGCGIAPEIRDRIFDPFFSTKKTGEGSGLGLSVSYGIVKDHGGDITVESAPGEWTEFTVLLPIDRRG